MRRQIISIVFVFSTGLGPAAFGQSPDGPSELPTVEPTVQRLIGDLSSPRWRDREIAAAKLAQKDSSINDALRDAFLTAREFETRNRIKSIAQEIYLNETIGPIRAFLGIQHEAYESITSTDQRIPIGMTGVKLTMVIWGSAASMAGLKAGDVIIALNGDRGTTENSAAGFTKWIGQQSPGTTCTLTVLRGGSGRMLMNSGQAHFDPRGFSRTQGRVVLADEDPRVPPNHAGIVLEDVTRADSRLNLESGDLVLSIDGEAFTSDEAMERFKAWSAKGVVVNERPDDPPAAPVIQIGPGGRMVVAAPTKPSIQLMRGGRILDFQVTLLGRPANLDRGRAWQRGEISPERLREADMAFEALWDSTVGKGGPPADRKDAAPLWRMDR